MEWLRSRLDSDMEQWTLFSGDCEVARVSGSGECWGWLAGLDGLAMILQGGFADSREAARRQAEVAAKAIESLSHASWAIDRDGRAVLSIGPHPLAIVARAPEAGPLADESLWDWSIPETRIGGAYPGRLDACVIASREAASYWGERGLPDADLPSRRQDAGWG